MVAKVRRSTHSAQYRAHIASPEWARIRRAALERSGYCCALCGRSKQTLRMHGMHLEVHHRTYVRLGHELPEDLTVLCAGGRGGCHALADAQRRAANGTRPARRRGRKRRLPRPLRDLRNAALGLGSVIVLLKLAAVTLPT